MITIDGSRGEGGGQILRSALGLSLVTGKPFTIDNIRAKRKKPGLMRQHLTAVLAARDVGQAEVTGASLNSQKLTFAPKTIQGGLYRFSIGTAGSCTLVLQTVLPALMIAGEPSDLVLEGGTHNPYAPPFPFLEKAFLPLLRKMGVGIEVKLEAPGFYPAGGGKFTVHIDPVQVLTPLALTNRGAVKKRMAQALVAELPEKIGHREINTLRDKLGWPQTCFDVHFLENSRGPGNIVVAEIESENVTEVFTGFGEKGVKAEHVARKVVREIRDYLATEAAIGIHLADQLLIPLAMAGGGRFTTLPPTLHTQTNIWIVQQFLDVQIEVDEMDGGIVEVQIEKREP